MGVIGNILDQGLKIQLQNQGTLELSLFPLTSSVTLGKFLNFTEPQFLHVRNGGNLRGLWRGLNEIITHVECFTQNPAEAIVIIYYIIIIVITITDIITRLKSPAPGCLNPSVSTDHLRSC